MTRSRRIRPLLALLVSLAPLATPTSAWAAAPPVVDAATTGAARSLSVEGLALFDAGKFDEAVDKLSRADQLVGLPTTGLNLARAYTKVGKLVEASEKLRAVTQITLDASANPAQSRAREVAETELKALAPKLPTLIIALVPDDPNASVLIDGKRLPSALFGVKRPTNPGERNIEVTFGGAVLRRQVKLAEGSSERIVIELPAAETDVSGAAGAAGSTAVSAAGAAPTPGAAGSGTSTGAPPQGPSAPRVATNGQTADNAPPSSGLSTAGVVLLGAGGAGLVTAGVFGLLTMSSVSDLEACTDDIACLRADQIAFHDDAATQQRRAFIALGVGAALGATGGVLLALSPSSNEAPSTALLLGPTSARLQLKF